MDALYWDGAEEEVLSIGDVLWLGVIYLAALYFCVLYIYVLYRCCVKPGLVYLTWVCQIWLCCASGVEYSVLREADVILECYTIIL